MHRACIDKIEDLNQMADGLMAKDDMLKLREHMSVCHECQAYYDDIISLKKVLSSMTLEMPSGLNEKISAAVREMPSKKHISRSFYRYATVAAACLALVVTLFATGTFRNPKKTDNSLEMAELQDYGSPSDDRNLGMKSEGDFLTVTNNPDESVSMPLPEPMPETDEETMVWDQSVDALAGYRFSSSAVESPDTVVVNPDGMPLDSGYGDMQDVFYASAVFSVEEMLSVLKSEFKINDIISDNGSIFFYMDAGMLPKLEVLLGLVSADESSELKDMVSIRIISVAKPVE